MIRPERLKTLYALGYRYVIVFASDIEPLAVKAMTGIASLMRVYYPNEKGWHAVEFDSEGNLGTK